MPRPLRNLTIQLTDTCNLACAYCYYAHKEPRSMALETIDKAIDLFAGHLPDDAPTFSITFFGGEPFLAVDRMRYTLDRAHAVLSPTRRPRRGAYSVTTNGTRFDEDSLELCNAHGIAVQLSLDGGPEAHDRYRIFKNGGGSFSTIEKNLPRLLSAPRFRVRMTVTPETVRSLSSSIQWMVDAGIRRIAVGPVAEASWTEDDFDAFGREWRAVSALYLSELWSGRDLEIRGLSFESETPEDDLCRPIREFGCGAATTFVFVDIHGDIYPCHRYPGYFDKSPEVRLGNVSDGLDPARREVYVEHNRGEAKTGCESFAGAPGTKASCSSCAVRTTCGGSCMAVNHFVNGNPRRPPPAPGRLQQIMLAVQLQAFELHTRRNHGGADVQAAP